MNLHTILAAAALALTACAAAAQTDGTMEAASDGAPMAMDTQADAMAGMARPEPILIRFDTGSARVSPDQEAMLDRAMRTFVDGGWAVIEVSGVADTVGAPRANLALSLRQAQAVADGLMARGLDPMQLQLRARGNSELAAPTGDEAPEPANRVAEITWRRGHPPSSSRSPRRPPGPRPATPRASPSTRAITAGRSRSGARRPRPATRRPPSRSARCIFWATALPLTRPRPAAGTRRPPAAGTRARPSTSP